MQPGQWRDANSRPIFRARNGPLAFLQWGGGEENQLEEEVGGGEVCREMSGAWRFGLQATCRRVQVGGISEEECRIASAVCCVRGIGGMVEMQIRICWCVFDVAISGGVMVQAVRGGMMK
jgi:hypothetical protein